eukprot:g77394.t1
MLPVEDCSHNDIYSMAGNVAILISKLIALILHQRWELEFYKIRTEVWPGKVIPVGSTTIIIAEDIQVSKSITDES